MIFWEACSTSVMSLVSLCLSLESREFTDDSMTGLIQNWTGVLVAVMTVVISTCIFAMYCCRRGVYGEEGRRIEASGERG